MALKGKGSFEYVYKDYQQLRSALIDLIPLMTNRWTDRNESDPGMVLLELFCGVGDMLSYYLDVNANQAFLPTATQRGAVIDICKLIDYYLADAVAASGSLLFTRAPHTTTSSPTTLASDIVAGTTYIFNLNVPYSDYQQNDMIYLSNGIDGEFCRIRKVDVNQITIYGVTQYGYLTGATVERIDSSYKVQIRNVRCKANEQPFETDALGVYIIDGGNVYVDEARILDVDYGLKELSLTNTARYRKGDKIFIQDVLIPTRNASFLVINLAGRVLTIREPVPVWITDGCTVGRLIPCAHGETKTEIIGSSDGTEAQKFILGYTPVVIKSLVVEVDEGIGFEPWMYVPNFLNSDSNDNTFTTLTLADDTVQVQFGDNRNGKIPTFGAEIRATYRQGGGIIGNVGAGTITVIESQILDSGTRAVALMVINPEETNGGQGKETIEQAKVRAPASLRALNRCVNEADYAAKAVDFADPDWGQAALASSTEVPFDNAVVVYVWGEGSNGMAATVSSELKNAIAIHLKEIAVATMSVSVIDGDFLPIDITGTIHIKDNVVNVEMANFIDEAVDLLFNVNNVTIGDDFFLGNLYEAMENIPGVDRADFTLPLRPGVTIPPNTAPIRGTVNITVVGGY